MKDIDNAKQFAVLAIWKSTLLAGYSRSCFGEFGDIRAIITVNHLSSGNSMYTCSFYPTADSDYYYYVVFGAMPGDKGQAFCENQIFSVINSFDLIEE